MSVQPTKLELVDRRTLLIQWSDGRVLRYSVRKLRDECPCATCREKRTQEPASEKPSLSLPVLSQAEAAPLEIRAMQPVGNYAYGITFSDGHSTGIYSFATLQALGQEADAAS